MQLLHTTIMYCVPTIVQMKNINDLAEVLQSELKLRIMKYTAPGTGDHDPIMLAAMALDPRYRVLLNPIQLESAKKLIVEVLANQFLCSVSLSCHLRMSIRL